MIYFITFIIALTFSKVSADQFFSGSKHPRAVYEKKFLEWLTDFPELKPINDELKEKMLLTFSKNDDLIIETNSKNLGFLLGHNQFSHMTSDEFAKHLNLKPIDKYQLEELKKNMEEVTYLIFHLLSISNQAI